MILDPPKFARSRKSVDDALRAYHRLNRPAVELLEPGGILVTCSCSGHVSAKTFCTCWSAWRSRPAATSRCWNSAAPRPTIRSPPPAWRPNI